MTTIAELLFVVATEAGSRKTLVVDLAVEGDIPALTVTHDLPPPGHQQIHVRGTHITDRSDALLLIDGKHDVGKFGEIFCRSANVPKRRGDCGDKEGQPGKDPNAITHGRPRFPFQAGLAA